MPIQLTHSLVSLSSTVRVCTLCLVAVFVAALGWADSDVTATAAAIAADIAREPVRFAAGALAAAPPGALTAGPGDWPPLVPDCTAAYLNASIVSAVATSNTPTVVRVEVPAGRAVSLRGCRTPSGVNVSGSGLHAVTAGGLWHVHLVLAMGRSSAVALEAWDVAVGGVTIEGPVDNVSSVVDALVVVGGGSRIVAGTGNGTAARAASSDPADDVHALSVVAPPGAQGTLSVSGLGVVVMQGSVVRSQHDGAGVLYASACGVRAGAARQSAEVASLAVEALRVVVSGGSSVEASATHTGAAYDYGTARRAHAATIQALPGARVTAARVVVSVLTGSTASAFGDSGSGAAGGISVNGRERGSSSGWTPTTVAVSQATLIAAGPHTIVRVTTKGHGLGASAMGVASYTSATASMTNATVFAVGPNTTVAVIIAGGGGGGASTMGVASSNGASASMTNTTVYAVGPGTTVAVHVTGGSGFGDGAAILGVSLSRNGRFDALGDNTFARCANVTVTAEGAGDIVVFNSTHPGVTFAAPSPCPPPPKIPGPHVALRLPATGSHGRTLSTESPSGSAPSASKSNSVPVEPHTLTLSVHHHTATAGAADAADYRVESRSTTASFSQQPITSTGTEGTEANPSPYASVVAGSPVPAAASASASVLAGVLLPSSASKPMGNARALQVADVCLSAVGEGEALEDAEPGEWPSDFAVIVARWRLGNGGDEEERSAARARAAGAAVACAVVACAAVSGVVCFAGQGARRGYTAALPVGRGSAADFPSSLASALAVAFAVAAAYLVPNALEVAVVAATAGLGGATGAAAAVAGCAMVAAVVPVFAAPVVDAAAAATVDDGTGPSSSTGELAGRVAGFLHPVLVDGLRDEASPLLRAHALLDVAAACVIAAASGATQAGVRVGGSCVLLALVMAAAAAGLTAYYALVRPFAARLEVIVATAQAGTLAVLCGLTLAAVASGGTAVSGSALEATGLAAEVVSFGAPVVLVAPVAWAWFRGSTGDGGAGRRQLKNTDGAAAAVPLSHAGRPIGAGDVSAPLLTLPALRPDAVRPKRAAETAHGADGTAGDGGGDKVRHVRQNPLNVTVTPT